MKRSRLLSFVLCLSLYAYAVETLRPTADADIPAVNGTYCTGVGTKLASSSGANAYDGSGASTSVNYAATGLDGGTIRGKGRVFTTWATPSGGYSALSLKVNTEAETDVTAGGGTAVVKYSTNGGSNWTVIKSDDSTGGWFQQTSTVALSAGQDLTQLQVDACVIGYGGDGSLGTAGSANITLYDIWTEGTLSAGGGPSMGQRPPAVTKKIEILRPRSMAQSGS
jgi:hypothetical protein